MPPMDRPAYSRKNTREFVEYKKTLKCIDCGLQDHRVLQFHHRDPKDVHRLPSGKRVTTASLVRTGNRTKLQALINACDVLCAKLPPNKAL